MFKIIKNNNNIFIIIINIKLNINHIYNFIINHFYLFLNNFLTKNSQVLKNGQIKK